MIASLQGTILEKKANSLVLDVGGVGYEVSVLGTLLAGSVQGDALMLKTAHIVREDTEDLYGFVSAQELQLFHDLLRVGGVGPKTALAILELGSIGELVRSIQAGDVALLMRAGGIGRKLAERIIVELKERVTVARYGITHGAAGVSDMDALEALVELGFPRASARHALTSVAASVESSSERVKAALKILGKK